MSAYRRAPCGDKRVSAYRHKKWRGDRGMTAETLLTALENDSMARLRWRVAGMLGLCPASPRVRLLSRRRVMEYACHLALDARATDVGEPADGANPNFDVARFRALSEGMV